MLRQLSFESIARRLARVARVSKQCTRSQGGKGRYWRAEFTLAVRKGCNLVDLLHNGKDGYRARYFRSCHEGDRANEFLMNLLRPKLMAAWRRWGRRRFEVEWLNKSIGKGAKVWVHQGRWSRGKKRHRIRIQLSVDKWLAHLTEESEIGCTVFPRVQN